MIIYDNSQSVPFQIIASSKMLEKLVDRSTRRWPAMKGKWPTQTAPQDDGLQVTLNQQMNISTGTTCNVPG